MAYQAIVEEIKDLPEESQDKVLEFIQFLKYKKKKDDAKKNTKEINAEQKFDLMAGKLVYMADDFDETPECFKEYM